MSALREFSFTKSWNNPSDFPTYQDSESKVRADLQCLHDEVRNWLNMTLLPWLSDMDSKVSVTGVTLREDGHIVVSFSDGKAKDLGDVIQEVPKAISEITYSAETKAWTITYTDGSTKTIDVPSGTSLSDLTEDENHRTVTDAEKAIWNNAMPRDEAMPRAEAMPISGGTFTGVVKAGETSQSPATSLLRNSRLVSVDTDPTVEGEINWTYQ